MGSSAEAYASNLRFHYKAALYYHLLEAYPRVVLSAENPKADMRNHPITRAYVEVPVEKGGLGMHRIDLSYCMLINDDSDDSRRPLQKKDT